jgi:hypothetical protein
MMARLDIGVEDTQMRRSTVWLMLGDPCIVGEELMGKKIQEAVQNCH